MPADASTTDLRMLPAHAHAAFDDGDLIEVSGNDPYHHYMLGLVCKYLRDWALSLKHSLHSIALRSEQDEASQWNTAIAATALGDWAQARRQWQDCAMSLPDGDGPINGNFGVASIRLNA